MSFPRTHLLARAVIEQDGHILLAQASGHTNTFLPGGHLEAGEGLARCLTRELFEETGLGFSVGAFLGVVEHEWRDKDGGVHHEINHLFAATCEGLSRRQAVRAREAHLTFEWVFLDQLDARQLEPSPLRALLTRGRTPGAWFASTLPNPGPETR
ncbi:NUDIX domain-containing protein [Deinococcus aestuarii]|uniref:NUDIX domain-containing protein n=1 Tax=Deinococcus aestuarii TaxID=2774531 RepID=UPI001C0CFF27|nr:NUDIX domain-containing protein [Deinococcus aestuarii]